MSRIDQITLKGPLTGNTRSKALNHSKRKWNVNLQKVRVKTGPKSSMTVRVSAQTLKTLRKENRLA